MEMFLPITIVHLNPEDLLGQAFEFTQITECCCILDRASVAVLHARHAELPSGLKAYSKCFVSDYYIMQPCPADIP